MNLSRISVFLGKEFIGAVITFFLVMSVLFILLHSIPGGDPVTRMYPFAPGEIKEQIREHWGLNKPLFEQYIIYMKKVFTLDYRLLDDPESNALKMLMYFLPYTLLLFGTATIISYGMGTALGMMLISEGRGKKLITGLAIILYAIPSFLLAVYFRTWFVFKYQIFPPVELALGDDITVLIQFDTLKSMLPAMALPLLVLVLVGLARPLFLMRDQMTLLAEEPFVLTARAKGLPEQTVHSRHVARNALLPLLNDASINLAIVFGGGILIEYIFTWPGIGMVLLAALIRLNYFTISACIFLLTAVLLLSMMIVDLLNAYLDPRVMI